MTQDEWMELLSARIDGELTPAQHEQLEQHLQENPDDRIMLEAFQLQDEQLRQSFEPQRHQADRAAEAVSLRLPSSAPSDLPRRGRKLGHWLGFVTAASLIGVLFGWQWKSIVRVTEGVVAVPRNEALLADAGIRPKARVLKEKEDAKAQLGATLETGAGERKRVALPDGSTLFLNEKSKVSLLANREISLDEGEIYLSAVPAAESPDGSKFVVQSEGRTLTAVGTKFAVRTGKDAPNLMVTQGSVQVSDRESPVFAGKQLSFVSTQTDPAPRASVALDWTRELLTESETPLVPGGKHSGGALVAVDPYGQEAKLSLTNYHVDVHIEDGFARTTIDQTYFNHENFQMEGTFYFPLPPDASLSRLAMYVNGVLMEGGMAEREHARRTYEQIRHSMRDPALLEWVDGSMFKMRVFPLEARQEKRLLLSYSQKLPSAYGRTQYRFPAGHSLNLVDRWSFQAFVKNGEKLQWHSPSHPKMKRDETKKEGLTLVDSEKGAKLDRDITLELIDPTIAPADGESIGWSSTEHDGQRYLMLRYTPDLPSEPQRERRDWVFLFESSGARDPLLARTQVEIVRSLLSQAEHDDTFNVLTVGTRVTPWREQAQLVNSVNVDSAIQFLESAHLIGATNLEAGIQASASLLQTSKNPYLVHLGGGIASLGESRSDRLVSLIPPSLKYVGVAVGKRFAPQLMKVAAEKTGGYFTQINPDESIAWRGFELFSTLNAPRLLNLRAETSGPTKMLNFSSSIVQGEAFSCVCKLPVEAKDDPTSVTIKGLLNGVPIEKVLKVEKVATLATYLPRTWAKLEIDRLLAEDSSGNKNRIIELSKQMYVMTPYTSLLVLENEQMYRDFKVDRGRKDHWAMYPAPAKIPVVYIPDPTRPLDQNAPNLGDQKPHENQVRQSILVRTAPPILTWSGRDARKDEAVRTYSVRGDGEFKERLTSAPADFVDFYGILGRSGSTRTRRFLSSGGVSGVKSGETELSSRAPDVMNSYLDLSADFSYEAYNRQDLRMLSDLDRDEKLGELVFGIDSQQQDPNIMWRGTDLQAGTEMAYRELLLAERDIQSLSLFDGTLSMQPLSRSVTEYEAVEDRWTLGFRASQRGLGTTNRSGWDANGRLHFSVLGSGITYLPQSMTSNELMLGTRFSIDGKRMTTFDSLAGRPVANDLYFFKALSQDELARLSGEFISDPSPELGKLRAKASNRGRLRGILEDRIQAPREYQRIYFARNERLFTDLVSFAPGMSSLSADAQAVVEDEAAPRFGSRVGRIDPKAKQLVDSVRTATWRETSVQVGEGEWLAIRHDGQGRYHYERQLPLGLIEQVHCDGENLWHLYPELGIGAKRTVSRFHRAEFAALVPDLLLPAEDLAHGADLSLEGENTLVLRPIGLDRSGAAKVRWIEHRLVVEAARIAEKQLVLMPENKVLSKVTHGPDGSDKLTDAKGKEIFARELKRKVLEREVPAPRTDDLVILPLPLRDRHMVYTQLHLDPNRTLDDGPNPCFEFMTEDEVLRLVAAELAAGRGDSVGQLWRKRFYKYGDRRVGFLVLMLSAGSPLTANPLFRELTASRPGDPLVRYLASQDSLRAGVWSRDRHVAYGHQTPRDLLESKRFLDRLMTFDALRVRWEGDWIHHRYLGYHGWEVEDGFRFVRANADNPLGLAALTMVNNVVSDRSTKRRAADLWRQVGERSGLDYVGKYEQARALYEASDFTPSRQLFEQLYAETLKKGILPPVDSAFRSALQTDQVGESWPKLMKQTAKTCVERKLRPVVVRLAWKCTQLGDHPLAETLLDTALDGMTDPQEAFATRLAAIEYLWATRAFDRVEPIFADLLKDPENAKQPGLWRLASQLASQRNQRQREIECLEIALEQEFKHLPAIVDLQTFRNDYGRLLSHYEYLVGAARDLQVSLPSDLGSRTVRAADRWRSIDPESDGVCRRAADILRGLGTREGKALAWDYLTTPLALKPNESSPWLSLADTLVRQGEPAMADQCYAQAFASEPTNAEILWNRAQHLQRNGDADRSRTLLRELADGDWQPRFQWLKTQARMTLEGR